MDWTLSSSTFNSSRSDLISAKKIFVVASSFSTDGNSCTSTSPGPTSITVPSRFELTELAREEVRRSDGEFSAIARLPADNRSDLDDDGRDSALGSLATGVETIPP
uniref:(northern house mosquito) hypothetical protein n=1 Tax=Culex pipiens TaxID=7175 RepID=A0A8D8A6M8_CULPI